MLILITTIEKFWYFYKILNLFEMKLNQGVYLRKCQENKLIVKKFSN